VSRHDLLWPVAWLRTRIQDASLAVTVQSSRLGPAGHYLVLGAALMVVLALPVLFGARGVGGAALASVLLVNPSARAAFAIIGSFPVDLYGAAGDGTTDDKTAVQAAAAAATATATAGGTGVIDFNPRKTYLLSTGQYLTVAPNLAGRVHFRGNGTKLKFATNFFCLVGMPHLNDHDTYQNLLITDFEIDVNGQKHYGGTIVSNHLGGGFANYTNFQDITVRRVHAYNAAATNTGNDNSGVRFSVKQANELASEPVQNWAKRIVCEDVRVEGANTGFFIGGDVGPTGTAYGNVLIDEIRYTRCTHILADTPQSGASIWASSNFQIGSRAIGGRAVIEGCYGKCSGDVGVEVNSMTDMVVRDTTIEDARTACFYYATHGVALAPNRQRHVFERCVAERHQLSASNTSGNGFTTALAESSPAGPVEFHNCKFYSDSTQVMNSGYDGWNFTAPHPYIAMHNCRAVTENVNYTTPSTLLAPSQIRARFTGQDCHFVIRDFYGRYYGTRDPAAGTLNISLVSFNPDNAAGLIDWDGMDIGFNVTNCAQSNNVVQNAAAAGSTHSMRGTIRRFALREHGGDATPRAIRIAGTATQTIDGLMEIVDCDFRKMTGGTEISFADATNKPYVVLRANKYRVLPIAAATITVGASPFVYQNLDGYAERVIVRGGTVSLIEVSVDGTNYDSVGVVAGSFLLQNAEYIRVTYTAAPTMRKVPLPT
jgi:hypothetical protein